MTPSLSVIIPFCNKSALTIRTIDTLLASQGSFVSEIILVDNASARAARNRIEGHIKKLRKRFDCSFSMLSWPGPFNWQKVNNFAAKRATGEVLCFLNNDVRFDAASRNLLRIMAQKALGKRNGVVGCLMRYPDGSVQHAGGHPDRGYCHSHFGGAMRPLFHRNRPHKYLTGACHVIAAEKFRTLGGYNRSYKLLGGDIDLCARAIGHGWVNWFIGSASLVHLEARTRRSHPFTPQDFRKLYYAIMPIYAAKDGVTMPPSTTRKSKSSLECYYRMPLNKIRKMTRNWLGHGLEFLPAIPHERAPRVLLFCDGLANDALLRLQSRLKKRRAGVLAVGHGLLHKELDGDWQRLDLNEIPGTRRVLWVDSRLDDVIFAPRKLHAMLRRSFPGHRVRLV